MTTTASSSTSDSDDVWVAVGPSISGRKGDLHDTLGPGYTVVDMLGPDRPPDDRKWIAVLGTAELPAGAILTRLRRRESVVLFGTGSPRGGPLSGTSFADLAETIHSLARRSRPALAALAS